MLDFHMLIEMEGVSEIQSRFKNILKIYLQKEFLKFTWGNPFQSSGKVDQNKVKITILQHNSAYYKLM